MSTGPSAQPSGAVGCSERATSGTTRRFAGAEGQEGIAAFREKRAARWVPTD